MARFGLIFDFDGLILDTEVSVYESWRSAYRAHGFDLSVEKWGVCIGTGENVLDPYSDLESLTGRALDREELLREHRRRVNEVLEHSEPMPGVVRVLDEADRLGLRLGVASSSPAAWVQGHLARLGLLERFHAVRTRDDVAHTKPDPELFLRVLDDLGLAAHQAVVFEDSSNGILGAKNAGLYTIAVPNAITRHLDLSRADKMVESLEAVRVEELLESLAGNGHV